MAAVGVTEADVDTERLQRALDDPDLAALYRQLAAEDVALAEAGMTTYRDLLDEADQHLEKEPSPRD
jgi:hypothetical protein